MDVASAEPDHAINSNWIVSANLQIVTGSSSKPTTGKVISYDVEPFAQSNDVLSTVEGGVEITTKVSRKIRIESEVVSGDGSKKRVVWSQDLSFSNTQWYLNNTLAQRAVQTSSGSSISTQDGITKSVDRFSYPLSVNFTAFDPGFNSWETTFGHSYERLFAPSPFVVNSKIRAHQTAGGYMAHSPNGNTGNGTNENQFYYDDAKGNAYWRTVNAAYNNITYDRAGGNLAHGDTYPWSVQNADAQTVVGHGVNFRLPGSRHGD